MKVFRNFMSKRPWLVNLQNTTADPEYGKFLLVESGILGFGIRNTAQGIRIPLMIGIQESKIH